MKLTKLSLVLGGFLTLISCIANAQSETPVPTSATLTFTCRSEQDALLQVIEQAGGKIVLAAQDANQEGIFSVIEYPEHFQYIILVGKYICFTPRIQGRVRVVKNKNE